MPRVLLPTALALALLGLGCEQQTRAERTLVVVVASGPTSLAPNATLDPTALGVLGNVYETLVDLDADLALVPGLAESWHSPDPLTWSFRLRADVRRHDGGVLTAQDVALSLDHARLDLASVRRGLLADVAAVEASDERTLRVRTRRPLDALPLRLAGVLVWGRPSRAGDPAVGTGPYRVAEWAAGGDVRLERHDPHRASAAAVRGAVFRAVPDAGRRLQLLRGGAAHLVPDISAQEAGALEADPRVATATRENGRVAFLTLDCARPPFRDRRVRQALALAIDRQALVAGAAGGAGAVADQIPSPDELGAHAASVPSRPFDLPGARRLLAEAGARGLAVVLDHSPTAELGAVAAALVADWRRAGIRAEPRAMSEAELQQRVARQDSALCLRSFSSETGDGRLAYEVLLHTRTGGFGLANAGSYSSPELDRLIREASAPVSLDERRMLLARLASKVQLDLPIIPLYSGRVAYAFDRTLAFEPRLDGRIRLSSLRWRE